MPLSTLTFHPSFEENPKLAKATHNLNSLLVAMGKKEIPESQTARINEIIAGINNFSGPHPELLKSLKIGQGAILKLLEKELKIVPQNHYQTLWMVLGMSVFGLPLGVAFGSAKGNMGLLAIGLPIGMGIGIAVGTGMDKKAISEGKQLDWKAN